MKRKDIPPAEFLVEARQNLPPPGQGIPAHLVRVDAGLQWGVFEIAFVVRQYSSGRWIWESAAASAGRVNYAAAYPGGREALIEVISEFRGHGRGVVPYGLGRGVDDAVI